jgi:hypothetical protein
VAKLHVQVVSSPEGPHMNKHRNISFIKSGIRILGFIVLVFNIYVPAVLLIAAEVVGIIEEMVV